MKKFKIALLVFYALLSATLVLFLLHRALPTPNVAVAATAASLLTGVTWLCALGINSLDRETGTDPARKAMGTSGWIFTTTGLILFIIPSLFESVVAYLFFACIFFFSSMLAIGIGIRSTFALKAPQPR